MPSSTKPFYLLNLPNWKVVEYENDPACQRDVTATGGYGVISYTWGRWVKPGESAVGVPSGVTWKLPVSTVFTINQMKEFLKTMGKTYVWWDMACIPQGEKKDLTPEQWKRKGTEIGKQRWIYEGASVGKIWVHQTRWKAESPVSPLRQILLKNPDPSPPKTPEAARDAIIAYADLIEAAITAEPWLTSIWTFQEGVMLNNSELIDQDRTQLSDPRFVTGKAAMVDLTKPITGTVVELMKQYTIVANGGEPTSNLGLAVKKYPDEIRKQLTRFVNAGLVAYNKNNPLHLIAARKARVSKYLQDRWFAVLGGLQIEIVAGYDADIDTIKADFLGALVDKYQWRMLLFAKGEGPSVSWLSISDGDFWPLGGYFSSFVNETGGRPVPLLTFDKNAKILHISKDAEETVGGVKQKKPYKLYKPTTWSKLKRYMYKQSANGVLIEELAFNSAEKQRLGDIRLLPFEKADDGKGIRCILVRVKGAYWVFEWIVEAWDLKDADIVTVTTDISVKLSNEA